MRETSKKMLSSTATRRAMFVLTPGVASDVPFNYSTALGMKQWAEATKKLGDELFDSSITGLQMFIYLLKTCAEVSCWKNTCKINSNSPFTEYGMVTINKCMDNAVSYFELNAKGDVKKSQKVLLSQQMPV